VTKVSTTIKAAFGRGRLRAGSLRSPVLAGQHQDHQAVEHSARHAGVVQLEHEAAFQGVASAGRRSFGTGISFHSCP
jgi:hypothetical protein